MSTSTFISHSENETRRFASSFARQLKGNEKICLIGPLGAGKTTFVRGFVEGFNISSDDVQSPTFTLVREYGESPTIYHVDLYRFDKEEDIFEAGIYELLTGEELVLVEWADKLLHYYPKPSIRVEMKHNDEHTREIVIENNI
ncbi:MAG TPA: tRNA (adenosine(37)-N6)-threonylcarbamoyltransferase complex ATPase subunit type 1 TsaE [Acidobacteriota bacterium]|nr:tRNA (adenosine(37)-N6)-threonylcarbamoyltransferase complex ATPase subunit type 1 TsaE [Acidobacteriota bacterium]